MWKTIPSTNNLYEASEDGDIRRIVSFVSNSPNGKTQRKAGGTILRPKTKSNGYQEVRVQIASQCGESRYVHRLVAEAWISEIPKGMTVNHKDGNKRNNRVDNLEIVTKSQNSKHAYDLGLLSPPSYKGELHPRATLTDALVLKIRKEHGVHKSIKKLTEDYPQISKGTLAKCVYRQTWQHI